MSRGNANNNGKGTLPGNHKDSETAGSNLGKEKNRNKPD